MKTQELKIRPGQIWTLDASTFTGKRKRIAEQMHILLTEEIAGNIYNFVTISADPQLSTVTDVLFTCWTLNPNVLGTVAHIRLNGQIWTPRLGELVCEIPKDIYKTILFACFNDYTLVDNVNTCRGLTQSNYDLVEFFKYMIRLVTHPLSSQALEYYEDEH